MRRIPLIAALITGLVLSSTIPAGAGAEVVPETYKRLLGSQESSDPLAELAESDDDALLLISENAGGDKVTSFQVSYIDIPDLEGTTSFRVELAAKGSPACVVRLWHWRKEKFLAIGEPILVSTEQEHSITIENPGRFVRRDKARARITCKDDTGFGVATDIARFIP